jgi:hypothetical protein
VDIGTKWKGAGDSTFTANREKHPEDNPMESVALDTHISQAADRPLREIIRGVNPIDVLI